MVAKVAETFACLACGVFLKWDRAETLGEFRYYECLACGVFLKWNRAETLGEFRDDEFRYDEFLGD